MVRVRRDYCQGMCRELGLSRWDPQVTSHSCCCGGVAEKIHKLKRRTIQLVFKFFCVSANHLYTQLGNSVFMGRMSLLVIILVLFLFVFLFISLYFSSSKKKNLFMCLQLSLPQRTAVIFFCFPWSRSKNGQMCKSWQNVFCKYIIHHCSCILGQDDKYVIERETA